MAKVAAEIGCNHKGDLTIAKQMIAMAAQFANADYAKFQKRDNSTLLTPEQFGAPHPNPMHSYGATYGEHRDALEFTLDQHRELQQACRDAGIEYSCSVWDMVSAREIASLDPPYIKIPSASNLNHVLLETLMDVFGGEIHVSLGMTTIAEADALVELFEQRGRAADLVLYACTSAYPAAFEDVCLLEITRLKERYGGRVKSIGFSGHHSGIAADVAALTLGAEWFERHFTLDRTWKGTDHAASLEPDGMRRLCRDLSAVSKALHYKSEEILPVERGQRAKLKWEPVRNG
ncbi:N-acetylneuraminate synthase family protein [soil metagenome]